MVDAQHIDLAFPIGEGRVPVDHGYTLYAALSATLPELHEAPWLGVHPLGGTPSGDALAITSRSRLKLRIPSVRLPDVLPLIGKTISVAGASLKVGPPQIFPLETRACLDARLVLIRLTDPVLPKNVLATESDFARRFQDEANRQLERLNVQGDLTLQGQRRMTVAGRRLLGFSVRIDGLNADESLAVQVHGLGGKRRMGCGIFRPTRSVSRGEEEAAAQ